MPYEVYKILHLAGIMLIFLGTGGMLLLGREDVSAGTRKLIAITHGSGLVIALVAGFGILAKLNLPFSGWVITKIVIWLLFAALFPLAKRKVLNGPILWTIALVLGVAAAWLGFTKPGAG